MKTEFWIICTFYSFESDWIYHILMWKRWHNFYWSTRWDNNLGAHMFARSNRPKLRVDIDPSMKHQCSNIWWRYEMEWDFRIHKNFKILISVQRFEFWIGVTYLAEWLVRTICADIISVLSYECLISIRHSTLKTLWNRVYDIYLSRVSDVENLG